MSEASPSNFQFHDHRAPQGHTTINQLSAGAGSSTNVIAIDNELGLDMFDQTQVLLGNEETQTPPGKR